MMPCSTILPLSAHPNCIDCLNAITKITSVVQLLNFDLFNIINSNDQIQFIKANIRRYQILYVLWTKMEPCLFEILKAFLAQAQQRSNVSIKKMVGD